MNNESSVGFDYQAVEEVKNQVANINTDVNELFARLDNEIQAHIGAGTSFYGQKANEFLEEWSAAKACFPRYVAKITAICDSAQAAGGIYTENENTGTVAQL